MYKEEYLYLNNSNINGTGVFTSIDIPAGTGIMIIKGEVISADECVRRENEEDNVYIFWIDDDTYIDTKESKVIKYLNHNCDPNCYVEERDNESLFLMAERDIKAGEELTIDYDYEEIYEECACDECVSQLN